MRDDLRHAYALLGLSPSASAGEVRAQYKQLARRWHPDRHQSDAASQATAAEQMSAINHAYQVIRRSYGPLPRPAADATAPPVRPAGVPERHDTVPGRRLTRSEIDGMVRAIGSESPLDMLLGSLDWYSDLYYRVVLAAWGLGLLAWVVAALARRDAGPLLGTAVVVVLAGVLCWAARAWHRRVESRRRQRHAPPRP